MKRFTPFSLILVALAVGTQAMNSGTAASSPPSTPTAISVTELRAKSIDHTIAAVDTKGRAVKFLGMTVEGKAVVFILDGDLPTPTISELLRKEVAATVNKMGPEQSFNAMMVADFVWVAYPQMNAATDSSKQDFTEKMAKNRVNVSIGDRLPFNEAFEKAFQMQPDEIYLVADAWGFYPRLADEVTKLNEQRKVKVNAVAFIHHLPSAALYERFMGDFEGQMKELAKANGGEFKVVDERDLGK